MEIRRCMIYQRINLNLTVKHVSATNKEDLKTKKPLKSWFNITKRLNFLLYCLLSWSPRQSYLLHQKLYFSRIKWLQTSGTFILRALNRQIFKIHQQFKVIECLNHHFKKTSISYKLTFAKRGFPAIWSKWHVNLRVCVNWSRQLVKIWLGCWYISILIFNEFRSSIFVRRPSRRLALLV